MVLQHYHYISADSDHFSFTEYDFLKIFVFSSVLCIRSITISRFYFLPGKR